jgi:hypothetical protein
MKQINLLGQVLLRRRTKAYRINLYGRSIIPDRRTRSTRTLEKNKCGTYTYTLTVDKKKKLQLKDFNF